jgi:plastocyanin
MKPRLSYALIFGGLATLLFAALACSTDLDPVEDRIGSVEQSVSALQSQLASVEAGAGKIAAPAATKHFYVTAFEVKGATDGIVPPSVNPKDLSDGYGFKPPGEYDSSNPNKWQVASYMWTPGAMTVLQGDTVELTVFVLNGDKHEVWVEAADGSEVVLEFEMNRGREYEFSFTASQAGVYRLICNTHEPTMTAYIQVLPRA